MRGRHFTGNVYIADTGHSRVLLVDPAGNVHTVAGTGAPGADASARPQLAGPAGPALDSGGDLLHRRYAAIIAF